MLAPEFAQSVQSRTSEYENIGRKGRVYIFMEEGVRYDEKSEFPGDLADVYAREGKRAGTYISDDGGRTWSRQ
jgi:hypothetical protein